jgi:FAD/FMN-containing dehydrogenase
MTTKIDLTFTHDDLVRLRSATDAVVAVPGDDAYAEEVSTWNLAVRLRPAVVVGAAGPGDVVRAVSWAADLGLPIGVNATGHGAVPNADGAVLINTRRLSRVTVDVAGRTATVAAGARMRNVTAAAGSHGLACVQGSSGSVGAVGFTLGGGLGVLSRSLGLAADHVLAIDVVTADGHLRTVDPHHQPDLFWALRGGKGNFGVVTAFTTALHPLPNLFGGGMFFDGAHAADVLHGWRRWTDGHTERTSSSVALLRLPDDPQLPDPIRGRFVIHVRMAHVGEASEGARLAREISAVAPVVLDTLGPLPPTALDRVHMDPPHPMPIHERGCLLDALPADALDTVVRQAAGAADSPVVLVEIRHLGGVLARPPVAPSAVPGRSAPYLLFALAPDVPAAGPGAIAAVESLFDAIAPWRSATTLPNFLGRTYDPIQVAAAWPADDRARLIDVKRAWDPANLFRLGHSLVGGRQSELR